MIYSTKIWTVIAFLLSIVLIVPETTFAASGGDSIVVKMKIYDHYAMTASDTGYFEFGPNEDNSDDPPVCKGSEQDMVMSALGANGYPRLKNYIPCVYNKNVEKWFIADPGNPIDKKKVIVFDDYLAFKEQGNDVYHYNDADFFPLDGKSGTLVDLGIEPDLGHNYGFTVHIHTRFKWNEANKNRSKLHFTGGDDVWMFIDGTLVMDHGGIHDNSAEVHLKQLLDDGVIDLKDGKIYSLDFFYAVRDNSKAHFNFGAHLDLLRQIKFDYGIVRKMKGKKLPDISNFRKATMDANYAPANRGG